MKNSKEKKSTISFRASDGRKRDVVVAKRAKTFIFQRIFTAPSKSGFQLARTVKAPGLQNESKALVFEGFQDGPQEGALA